MSVVYRKLGRTGLEVSSVCLGCLSFGGDGRNGWTLAEDVSRQFIRHALEKGINFFDTADVYGGGESERVVGRALRDMASREDFVLATKVGNAMRRAPNRAGLSRKHIRESIDASLQRLGVDYVDLYIVHSFDPSTPVEETLDALADVVRAGKALYLGASGMAATRFAAMLTRQRERNLPHFVSMQNCVNLIQREDERELVPFCRAEGIALTPWSPLARGFLAGNRLDATLRARTDQIAERLGFGQRPVDFTISERVAEIAHRDGLKPAQVALAWVAGVEGVVAPVIGATRLSHIDDALAACALTLNDATRAYLEEPYIARAPFA